MRRVHALLAVLALLSSACVPAVGDPEDATGEPGAPGMPDVRAAIAGRPDAATVAAARAIELELEPHEMEYLLRIDWARVDGDVFQQDPVIAKAVRLVWPLVEQQALAAARPGPATALQRVRATSAVAADCSACSGSAQAVSGSMRGYLAAVGVAAVGCALGPHACVGALVLGGAVAVWNWTSAVAQVPGVALDCFVASGEAGPASPDARAALVAVAGEPNPSVSSCAPAPVPLDCELLGTTQGLVCTRDEASQRCECTYVPRCAEPEVEIPCGEPPAIHCGPAGSVCLPPGSINHGSHPALCTPPYALAPCTSSNVSALCAPAGTVCYGGGMGCYAPDVALFCDALPTGTCMPPGSTCCAGQACAGTCSNGQCGPH